MIANTFYTNVFVYLEPVGLTHNLPYIGVVLQRPQGHTNP